MRMKKLIGSLAGRYIGLVCPFPDYFVKVHYGTPRSGEGNMSEYAKCPSPPRGVPTYDHRFARLYA